MCYEKNIRLWLINRKADARIDKTKIQDYKITRLQARRLPSVASLLGGIIFRLSLRNY